MSNEKLKEKSEFISKLINHGVSHALGNPQRQAVSFEEMRHGKSPVESPCMPHISGLALAGPAGDGALLPNYAHLTMTFFLFL
jgi:hypothetical protein